MRMCGLEGSLSTAKFEGRALKIEGLRQLRLCGRLKE
jgi:hypothetical protein